MEPKNKLVNGSKQLLFLTWELKGRGCHVDSAFLWRGNEVRVRVYSTSAVICTCVNFDIYFNKQLYHYHVLSSNGTATKVNIPDIRLESFKMVVDARTTSIEIFEKLLTPDEIKVQEETGFKMNDTQKVLNDQPIPADPKAYDFKPTANVVWIAFSDDLSSNEFNIAFPAPKVAFWVKKSLDKLYDPNVSLFTYAFYSRSVCLLPLKINGFVCEKAYDVCEKVAGGIHCTLHFEIADKNNTVRKFDSFAQGAKGIIALLAFLGKVSDYCDWDDYDSQKQPSDIPSDPDGLAQKKHKSTTTNYHPPSAGEGTFNEETEEWEGVYPEQPQREKESWVSVTKDFTIKEVEAPYKDNNLLLWIHKSFDYKQYDGSWLFKYNLFSPDLQPTQLKESGFTCLGISDFCQSTGCGNHCTVKFEISDKNNTLRSFRGFEQMESGVIEAIAFMRLLGRFEDWKDYNAMKVLTKELGKSDIELDKMIASELDGTGIRLS